MRAKAYNLTSVYIRVFTPGEISYVPNGHIITVNAGHATDIPNDK